MLGGHLPELYLFLVFLIVFVGGIAGLVWLFGLAVGRGIARGKQDR